ALAQPRRRRRATVVAGEGRPTARLAAQVHREVVERLVVPHDDVGAAGDVDSGVGRARRRGAGRGAVTGGAVLFDEGPRRPTDVADAVPAIPGGHVAGDHVVGRGPARDLNPPLIVHETVVADDVVTVGVHHHGGAASTTIGARLVLSVDADVVRRYGHLLKIRARAHEDAIARRGRIHGCLDARELRV